jgi:GNAT superfamily N-acetyltransferase
LPSGCVVSKLIGSLPGRSRRFRIADAHLGFDGHGSTLAKRMSGKAMNIRSADETEMGSLARLWFDGWQDAHARIVPAELVQVRTLESFAQRLHAAAARIRVVGPIGEPVGFCIVKDDELYQLFVSAQGRGSGVAAALVADAEAILAAKGVETGWLACVIGNERAARFYAKQGWQRVGVMTSQLETSHGLFPLDVWRYEKRLS